MAPIQRNVAARMIHSGDVRPRDMRKNTDADTRFTRPSVISRTCHLYGNDVSQPIVLSYYQYLHIDADFCRLLDEASSIRVEPSGNLGNLLQQTFIYIQPRSD